jgi:ferritin-like metal-binding protein YciE
MKLFEHGLKDILWVEKALTKSIPKMIKKATSEELINALEEHLEVTEDQVSKVERVFAGIDKTPRAKKCTGMVGILTEGEELMAEFESPTLDAAIIMAAQKVEHYEMSSYISLITLARTLDLVKEADILQEILDEEMEADKLLTNIAVRSVHEMAIGEG